MKHPSICLWLHHSTKPSHNFVVKATNKQPKQRLAVRLEKKTDHIKMHEKQMHKRANAMAAIEKCFTTLQDALVVRVKLRS